MNLHAMNRLFQAAGAALLCLLLAGPAQAVTPTQFEMQRLLASDGTAGDTFGVSVAIDGDTALVGAPGEGAGAVYVFHWNGSTWIQEDKLTASDGAAGNAFGQSVAIDGDTALVGAYGDDDNGLGSGSAYIFRWNGSAWVQENKLTASDGSAVPSPDWFGFSVALDGDIALIGAVGKEFATGAVYVFRWNGSTWIQEDKLTASDGATGDDFGHSVALDSDTALIGARRDDDQGGASGSTYVFRWDGSTWTQEDKLTAADGGTGTFFGNSVALDGDTALIGANSFKAAYIFHWNGIGWIQEAKLTAADAGAAFNSFGYSVALNGNTAIIGATGDNVHSGASYVFVNSGGTWIEEYKLLTSDGQSFDILGNSVDISNGFVIAGAPLEDTQGTNAGAAYIFALTTANTPPVANAGPDQTVEASANPASPVTLDGTGSSDADGDTLTYSWSNTSVSASGVTPTLSLGLGVHTITLTVDDGSATATDEVVITVQDTTPPVITVPGDVTVYATGALTTVAIGTATATDLFEPIVIESDAPEQFPVGTTTVTWTATDPSGNSSTATQEVTVIYDWHGFFAPVNNLPTVNTVKAGQTVPVKWNVPTPGGSYIRDIAIVSKLEIATVACEAEGTEYESAIEAETTGASGLRYDTTDEQFIYNWKTSKSMKNSCKLFILGLNDGSYHYAKFKVK